MFEALLVAAILGVVYVTTKKDDDSSSSDPKKDDTPAALPSYVVNDKGGFQKIVEGAKVSDKLADAAEQYSVESSEMSPGGSVAVTAVTPIKSGALLLRARGEELIDAMSTKADPLAVIASIADVMSIDQGKTPPKITLFFAGVSHARELAAIGSKYVVLNIASE